MKLKHLFVKRQPAPRPLYEAIVAAARQPELYLQYGVADTAEGRLGLVILYLSLAMLRLRGENPSASQATVELFVADMEGNLRELGVSDVAIARHMREIEARYVNAMQDYQTALPAGGAADLHHLEQALAKHASPQQVKPMAAMVFDLSQRLAALDATSILAGKGLRHEEQG